MRYVMPALELFGIQFAWYFITTLNYRAVSEVHFRDTFITDVFIGILAFLSVRRVVTASTRTEMLAYILGGAIGAVCALWLSTFWF